MALNEMLLQNYSYMIDSDDEEVWSLGDKRCSNRSRSTSSESGFMLSVGRDPRDCKPDFRLFQDYFGLSNLLNNVQISEDNPLLHNNQRNLAVLQRRNRRSSWSSDASDSAAVLSPTIDGNQSEVGFDGHIPVSNQDLAMKQFPPPSMRLSKEMREHIISGAYQLQIANRITDKVIPPPPPPPPVLSSSPPRAPLQTSVIPNMPNTVRQQQPGHQVCVFCRNNGESESVFSSHVLKDNDGRTSCPILRAYTCPICKANGDNSHTIKYCPMNQSTRNSVVPTQPSNLCFQQRNQPLPMPRLPPPFGSSFPNIPLPPLPISPVGLTLGKMN